MVTFQVGLQYATNKRAYSQKLTPYLFQNDVVLYFESYWKSENVADIIFLASISEMIELPNGKRTKFCD